MDMSSKSLQSVLGVLTTLTLLFFHQIDQQIGTLLYRDIQYAYFDFIENILIDCEVNPSNGRIPFQWNKPVYGDRKPNFTDFAAPGVILT